MSQQDQQDRQAIAPSDPGARRGLRRSRVNEQRPAIFAPGPLQCGRNDLLYLDGNLSASTDGILAHGFDL
jgi:hypothetical protein